MNTACHSIFITGTDTGIGKTTITAALLLALQQLGHSVRVLKPIETGVNETSIEHSDAERLRNLCSPCPSFDEVCLYSFSQPLAPLAASRKTGLCIDPFKIQRHLPIVSQISSHLLIEGAGGIFTPIAPQYTMRDLITLCNLPCLIIGQTALGGVNHCLLTLQALQAVGSEVKGIVLNDLHQQANSPILREQHATTVELIREWSSVPIFGPMPFTKKIFEDWRAGISLLSQEPEIQRLAKFLSGMEQETV